MNLVIGGVVPPRDVVGRVHEERDVHDALRSSGAVLVGDRRHGKTSLARLVQTNAAAAGAVVVSVSAERETYEEFVGALTVELGRLDPVWAQELTRLRVSLTAGPVKVERVERAARAASALDELLDRTVDRCRGKLLTFFIDEVTVLARNLERDRPGSGDSFLHLLRRFRQDHPGQVATVLSGSIGFHHVSRDAFSTVNDIPKITVGPIRSDHAAYLAECLLLGSGVPVADMRTVAQTIAEAAENVPYYIQHLVAATRSLAARTQQIVHPPQIAELVEAAITGPHDLWDLRHYRDRLDDYYGADAETIAKLLDIYAHADGPLAVDTVFRRLQNEGSAIKDRARLVRYLERLAQDHYLTRSADTDRFASALVQRAWKAMRR